MKNDDDIDQHKLAHYEFSMLVFTISCALVLAIAAVACVRYLIDLWGK